MKKNGFTLIELLVVIVVISVLATLVVGGSNSAVRVSREKRRKISCQTLQTAIYRYRTEYNKWPGGVTPSKNLETYTFEGENNKKVFGALRRENNENYDHIIFIDETAFFTPDEDEDGNAVKLSEWKHKDAARPLVFVARSGRWTGKNGKYLYYRVTIDFSADTVTVDTIKNGVDQFYNEVEDEKLDD